MSYVWRLTSLSGRDARISGERGARGDKLRFALYSLELRGVESML